MEHSEEALFSLTWWIKILFLVYLLGIEYQISELDPQDCPILLDCFLYWLILCDLYIFSFESFFRNMHCKYSLKACTLTFHPLSIDIQHRHFNIYLHFHKKLAWKFYLFIFLNTLKILFLCNFYWSGWEVRYHCFFKVLKTLIFSSRFIISTFKINFYWSIVALQC